MKIYFLRHAEAEDGPVDAERALTAKGRRDARRMGRFFAKTKVQFDLAFTSPLVRARQTAERVLKECPLGGRRKLDVSDVLSNDPPPRTFERWLKSLPPVDALLLVGHEPSMSRWVRAMLGLPRVEALPLSKGAVARIDTSDRHMGQLKLLIGPRQLP